MTYDKHTGDSLKVLEPSVTATPETHMTEPTPRTLQLAQDIIAERYGKPLVAALQICLELETALTAALAGREEILARHKAVMHEADRRYDELLSESGSLRLALEQIANLALAPMVDMADPPEDQARDWSNVAKRAWEIARAALASGESIQRGKG